AEVQDRQARHRSSILHLKIRSYGCPGKSRDGSTAAPTPLGLEGCPAFADVARETSMAPGPALGARHPPDLVETNIDPVSLFGGWPTPAISSGPCGAPLARHLSRRRGAEPREQGACRADRLLHRDVRRPAAAVAVDCHSRYESRSKTR